MKCMKKITQIARQYDVASKSLLLNFLGFNIWGLKLLRNFLIKLPIFRRSEWWSIYWAITHVNYIKDVINPKPDYIHQSPGEFVPETRDDPNLGGCSRTLNPQRWKDYWDNRIRTEHRPLREEFFDRSKTKRDHVFLADQIIRATNLKEGELVFDFGCGNGRMLKLVWDRRAILRTGIDYSQESILRARESYGNVFELKCCGVDDVAFAATESFDVAVCVGVISYYLSKEIFISMLKEMMRITRRDGRIYLHSVLGRDRKNHLVVPVKFWLGKGEHFGNVCDLSLIKSSPLRSRSVWHTKNGNQVEVHLLRFIDYPDYSVLIIKR